MSAGWWTNRQAIRCEIRGTVLNAAEVQGQFWVSVGFGSGNVLVISPHLAQVIEMAPLRAIGLDPAAFQAIALKSRVHFRRGFHDNGFAKTVLLVEPTQPFLGTVRLDGLRLRQRRPEALLPLWRSDVSGERPCAIGPKTASAPRKEGPNSQATAVGPQTRFSKGTNGRSAAPM